MFLKADRALRKNNFLFHLKSKTNSVNFYVSEEYKNEREIQTNWSAKRDDQVARPTHAQTCFNCKNIFSEVFV